MNIKDCWNPSSPSYPKARFVNKAASADWEFDDSTWDYDEDEHVYSYHYLTDELVKLKQWNEMTSGGAV